MEKVRAAGVLTAKEKAELDAVVAQLDVRNSSPPSFSPSWDDHPPLEVSRAGQAAATRLGWAASSPIPALCCRASAGLIGYSV